MVQLKEGIVREIGGLLRRPDWCCSTCEVQIQWFNDDEIIETRFIKFKESIAAWGMTEKIEYGKKVYYCYRCNKKFGSVDEDGYISVDRNEVIIIYK